MDQSNKDIALLLWQGREMMRLHSQFIHHLKISCVRAKLKGKPMDIADLADKIDALEGLCDLTLQQTSIPAEEKANHV